MWTSPVLINVALMVGVEICSGITDLMIDQVISHCAQITSLGDLIEFGIPAHYADYILSIIIFNYNNIQE